MAEEGTLLDLEGLGKQLQSLVSSYSSDELRGDSKTFCSEYCKLVEEYTSRWQTPLPQLRILEAALCHFTRASSSFPSSCDHVLHTLSSLALSVFELLLFFDELDFHKDPLKHFSVKFQVEPLVRAGGAWASTTLKEILRESSLPQNEVDRFLSSELPVFLELRVRYLISCERVSEALALAKCCIRHPTAGKHFFFLQVYLTWLYKTQRDQLLKEVGEKSIAVRTFLLSCHSAVLLIILSFNSNLKCFSQVVDLSVKDAVHIIVSLEYEETNDLLLALCQVFLSQQLGRGDMYYLWELVFVWSKLHNRLNTSKQAFLEESRRLMLSATNVYSIFPFVRVVIQELGGDGVQFCVELCADALKSCLPCDVITKSLICKTIAGLLPNDLEVCRACALIVFFLERTVEAYKMVYSLYMLPDQDYHVEHSPIRNQIRFETLQVLKKDLYFDPEFWNLIALRTNCLKLMSEKVVDAALKEIMEEPWVPNYSAKEISFVQSTSTGEDDKGTAKKPHHNDGRHKEISTVEAPKKLKLDQGKTRLNVGNAVKKKGNHRSKFTKEASQPLRRSFWQLDRIHDRGSGQLRRVTRLSEKDPPKRRIQKPKWLLEDSGNLQESKLRKHGLKHRRVHQSSALKRSEIVQLQNSTQPKGAQNSCTKHEREFPLEAIEPASAPQVILELSLPDNELLGTFIDDCNRQKVCPPMLFYKPTLKLPDPSHPVKVLHGKEVILRARDATMLVQLLHCYARRPKGKGNGSNIHGSVSTITRSSAHGSPPKEPLRVLCEKPNAETRGGLNSDDAVATERPEPSISVLQLSAKELLEKTDIKKAAPLNKLVILKGTETQIVGKNHHSQSTDKVHTTVKSLELSEESSVEMVTFASQSPAVGKVTQQPTTASTEFSQTFNTQSSQIEATEYNLPVSSTLTNENPDSPCHMPLQVRQALVNTDGEQQPKPLMSHSENDKKIIDKAKDALRVTQHEHSNHINDISALVTERVTQFPPVELQDMENHKEPADTRSKESVLQNESNVANSSSHTVPKPATTAYMQGNEQKRPAADSVGDFEDNEMIDTQESYLEYCCTTDLPRAMENHKQPTDTRYKVSGLQNKSSVPNASIHIVPEPATTAYMQGDEQERSAVDDYFEGNKTIETEESKLEYCCTAELPRAMECYKQPIDAHSKELVLQNKSNVANASSHSVPEPATTEYLQGNEQEKSAVDDGKTIKKEESKLEYCCNAALPRDIENPKQPTHIHAKESVLQNKRDVANASSHKVPEPAITAYMQGNEQARSADDDGDDDFEDDETVETEESKLEYCCTFCQKDFKGRRVVIHAMFHFRKDECMFCGTMFKDDLLAMMHLSDHIEKLKRSKELASNKAQQECVSETKDVSQSKTSAKDNSPNRLSDHHISRRLRKSSICNKSVSHPEAHLLLKSRNLRSNDKPVDGCFVHKNLQNECNDSKFPESKVNGHIGKNSQLDQMKQTTSKAEDKQRHPPHSTIKDKACNPKVNHVMPKSCESFASSVQKRKLIECSKDGVIKDRKKVNQDKRVEPIEKVDCPADGCTWSTDLCKNRVALLYHALEHHYGDTKPLELSFKVANNKCSICMRVLWSFEHFQHHVERHWLSPRHPCLHLGCTARFKTGNEMRRHARKHTPLQAVCCLPGCSELFICLWALNLHEREHYASKSTKPKPVKTVDLQTDDKPNSMQVKARISAMKGTLSQPTRKFRGHVSHDSTAKSVSKPPSSVKTSLVKEELKTRNESKHSNILKNLCSKDTTTLSSNYSLNLRLRKGQTTKTNLVAAKSLELPFFRRRGKLRHKFKKKQVNVNQTEMVPKRRGRPRKSKKATHDNNTTKRRKVQSLKSETLQPETAQPPTISNKLEMKEEPKHVIDAGKMTEIPHHSLKSKRSVSMNTRSDRVEQKLSSDRRSPLTVASGSSVDPAHKLSAANLTRCSASKDSDSLGANRTKKKRVTPIKSSHRESGLPATSRDPAKSTCIDVPQRSDDDKEKVEKTRSSQGNPADYVPSATAVNTKKSLIRNKKIEKALHWQNGKKKVMKKKSTEEPSDGTSDGSSSTMSNLKRNSKQEPSDVASDGSSSTMSNLKRNSKQEPSDVATDGTSSTTSNLRRTSEEEPSDVTSDGSSSTMSNLKRKSKEEPSDMTRDASSSTTSNSKRESKEKPSDMTRDGSSSTTSNLKRKSKEEPSDMTRDASSSTTSNSKRKSKEEPSDMTRDDSSSTTSNSKRKSKEESSDMTHDGSSSTTSILKRESNEEPSDVTHDGSSSTTSTVQAEHTAHEPTSKSKDVEVRRNKATKGIKKGEIKTSKKRPHPDQRTSTKVATESKPEAPNSSEVKARQVDNCVGEQVHINKTSECAKGRRGHSLKSRLAKKYDRSTLCMDTLAEYGKKHIRAPPTAYLDEKFTTMPKRRKEAALPYDMTAWPEEVLVVAAPQRQRCANCFTTFNSAEELHSHRQLQRCSSLFGFDSDDEGKS
ncbi:uncharacterized protein LOC133413858 isoform X2 [Phycodurus eques]|uniref:uncharacterized protein LOC133413858 isoform X2 n=1 Tax=Phycodurus eques TaxID=693459 RepID=UPI002ACED563|nr:uncharacterized protein LOC133413858 isoform X2 [Phycodurus eques]